MEISQFEATAGERNEDSLSIANNFKKKKDSAHLGEHKYCKRTTQQERPGDGSTYGMVATRTLKTEA